LKKGYSLNERKIKNMFCLSIKLEHTRFEGQAANGQIPSEPGDFDDAENEVKQRRIS